MGEGYTFRLIQNVLERDGQNGTGPGMDVYQLLTYEAAWTVKKVTGQTGRFRREVCFLRVGRTPAGAPVYETREREIGTGHKQDRVYWVENPWRGYRVYLPPRINRVSGVLTLRLGEGPLFR
jgi:hypothetical protein